MDNGINSTIGRWALGLRCKGRSFTFPAFFISFSVVHSPFSKLLSTFFANKLLLSKICVTHTHTHTHTHKNNPNRDFNKIFKIAKISNLDNKFRFLANNLDNLTNLEKIVVQTNYGFGKRRYRTKIAV
jgi:hypothetical protein